MATPKSLLSPLPADLANLTVHIGEDALKQPVKSFSVIAEIMRLYSTVWNAMLRPNGPFLEAGAKEISFPEDDPDAFEVVLAVLHRQVDGLPKKMKLTALKHLAIVIDKYDLSKAMRTILPRWTSDLDFAKETRFAVHSFDYEGWLTVSWHYGLEQPFSQSLTKVINVLTEDKEGRMGVYLGKGNSFRVEPLHLDHVPAAVVEYIRNEAKARMEELKSLGPRLYKDLADGDTAGPSVQRGTCFDSHHHLTLSEANKCVSRIFGSLHFALKEINKTRQHRPQDVCTVHSYATTLKEAPIEASNEWHHRDCIQNL